MGWIKRLLVRRPKSPAPPWVNPRFLAIVAGLGAVALALALWSGPGGPDADVPGATPQASTHREYVGFTLDEVATPDVGFPPCWPQCDPDVLLDEWKRQHDGILILKVEPVHERGLHLGYWVEWTDEVEAQ